MLDDTKSPLEFDPREMVQMIIDGYNNPSKPDTLGYEIARPILEQVFFAHKEMSAVMFNAPSESTMEDEATAAHASFVHVLTLGLFAIIMQMSPSATHFERAVDAIKSHITQGREVAEEEGKARKGDLLQ